MPVRICAIDVGTHSTRFLTCDVWGDGRWKPVDRDLKITALGKSLAREGRILPEAAMRSAEVIRSFAQRARGAGAEYIRASGTMALRSAANARDIIALLKDRSGIPVNILSGEEEAELIYSGIVKSLEIEDDNITAVDIGGGSTEIIWKLARAMQSFVSCETGCLTLTEAYLNSDPPRPSEIDKMEESISFSLSSALPRREAIPSRLVGAGGTITTAAAIELGMEEYDGNRLHGMSIRLSQIGNIYKKLVGMRLREREKVPGLMKERAPVIVAGLAIVKGIMDYLGSKSITVSDHGILLGVIMKVFNERS